MKTKSLKSTVAYLGHGTLTDQSSRDFITVSVTWSPTREAISAQGLSIIADAIGDALYGEDHDLTYSASVVRQSAEPHAHIAFIQRSTTEKIDSSMTIEWPPSTDDLSKIDAVLRRDSRMTCVLQVHDAERPHAHVIFSNRR